MTQAATGTGTKGSGKPRIKVHCKACGGRFAVGLEKAGKKGPCPKCGQSIVVPKAGAKPKSKPAKPAAAPAEAGGIDWGALADAEASATPTASQPAAAGDDYGLAEDASIPKNRPLSKKRAAPKVEAPAAAAAGGSGLGRLTPAQRAAIAKRAEAKASGKMTGYDKGDEPAFGFPSATAGIGLCLLGAAIGGAIWFGLLMVTGKELRFLAWVVGGLAGLGMWLGRGGGTADQLRRDGGMAFLAGVLALAGIIGAKVLMYNFGQEQFADNEIMTEAQENMREDIQRLENEYARPVPLEFVEPVAFDWLLEDNLRKQEVTPNRYYSASDMFRARFEQDTRRAMHTMEEDEVRDLYARAMLSQEQERPTADEAQAAYDAARAKFIEDNNLVDPYAPVESEEEPADAEDEEGNADADAESDEELDEDLEDEPFSMAEYKEEMRKSRKASNEMRRQSAAFNKAMKPFDEEHLPALEKARRDVEASFWQKWMDMSEDEIAEMYAEKREQEFQERLAAIKEAEEAYYEDELELTRHVYSDEFVENREAYSPIGFADIFFGIVAFGTAIGIVLGGGTED